MKTIVDDDDYIRLVQWKWCCTGSGYATRNLKKSESSMKKMVLMHRVIMNAPEGMSVDHIDGDPLNNRKSNLRLCTHAQNMQNSKSKKQTSSKYKGVYWESGKKRWASEISIGTKRVYRKRFKTEYEAAQDYNKQAKLLFGEFARLNNLE